MKTMLQYLTISFAVVGTSLSRAQDFPVPNVKTPDKETLAAITERSLKLGQALAVLEQQGVRDPYLADIAVFEKSGDWIQRHGEYFHEQSGKWTLDVLDRGLLRATQARRGESPWMYQPGLMSVRGYRSSVDGSIQPYAVRLPRDYGKDARTKWRLDVVLHGRDSSICEVKFLFQHSGDKPAAEDHPYIQLEIFGRGNNAYRWAGETDVFEAIDAFVSSERLAGRGELIDPRRVVLRGFSMGGAGSWHIGLHRPDRWGLIGPGAGFTTTRGYIKDLPAQLPAYIEKCLHIYDAVDYAENAFNVPVVAYSGEDDPQIQAARNIEARLREYKIPMTHLVAPGLKHQFPPEWQKKAEAEYAKFVGPGKGRGEYPEQVRFTTYTLRYPGSDWLEILGMEQHFERAHVDATRVENGFKVTTTNIRTLRLTQRGGEITPQIVQIDGQELSAKPAFTNTGSLAVYLQKQAGKWTSILPQRITADRFRKLQKISGLQGPIDDAFTSSFLCVRGTGTAWNAAVQEYADADLKRFQKEWDKFLRGSLPVKNDTDVTDDDIASKNLILFGDPASNSIIAQVLEGLPVSWTKDAIRFAGNTYPAGTHIPAMIFPSPLNISRYVVLNSGHTFHAKDFQGTNALLYPRLGDYAILKPSPTKDDPTSAEIVTAGLFDDFWQVPVKEK